MVQQSSSDMMMFMVQDLLDYAQIKARKFRKQILRFDIRKSIEKVMCIQRQRAIERGIEFKATYENFQDLSQEAAQNMIDEGIDRLEPDSNGKFCPVICSDESRIKQVLLGLQSNALKFTQKGKVEIKVRILNDQNRRFLQIDVEDTGLGIPKEQQHKLFKLFGFIQDQKQLNTKGIGLGLVIADQIVNEFNGRIAFKSEHGKGSIFQFSFLLEDSLENL